MYLFSVLNFEVNRGGWSAPRPGRIIPRKSPGTRSVAGWVDSRALSGRVLMKRKSLAPTGYGAPDRPGRSQSLY
jgi:hypothetical protein